MNYIKVQTELLKNADKRYTYKGKLLNYIYQIIGEQVYITDGNVVFIIPLSNFYLEIAKTFNSSQSRIFTNWKYADETAIFTGDCKVLPTGTKVLLFKCKEDIIAVDEKYMKYFDLEKSNFKGTNSKSTLEIYEKDTLVGMIMPVIIKETE